MTAPDSAATDAAAEARTLRLTKGADETRAQGLAHAALMPAVGAALTIATFTALRDRELVDVGTLARDLAGHVGRLGGNDLSQAEAMLLSQAHSLDAMFTALAHVAARNIGDNLEAAERVLRLALRAQGQSRATLETLSIVKNPKSVAFVRQANIAQTQQVNNGRRRKRRSRAIENSAEPNKLLEQAHADQLDPGTAGPTVHLDTPLAALALEHRPAHAGRQGEGRAQSLSRRTARATAPGRSAAARTASPTP